MLSLFVRLLLLAAICFGGYRVYQQQRTARTCELEVRNIEESVNTLLLPDDHSLKVLHISYDQHYSLWLYNAPPGKAIEVQLQTEGKDDVRTETLLRIPSRTTAYYGTLELQFDVDTRPPMAFAYQLNVLGPEFRKAELKSGHNERFDNISFANEVMPRNVSYLSKPKVISGSMTRSGIRIQNGMVMRDEIQMSRTGPKSVESDQMVLCAFDEVENSGKVMKNVQQVVRVVAVDE